MQQSRTLATHGHLPSHPLHSLSDGGPLTGKLRTAVDCFSGTWVPFYDLYGQRYWYDLASDRMTMDVEEVRREPAVRVMQRCWRGFMWRERLLRVRRRKFPHTHAPCFNPHAACRKLHSNHTSGIALVQNGLSNGAVVRGVYLCNSQ
jgi:hypothetical protein